MARSSLRRAPPLRQTLQTAPQIDGQPKHFTVRFLSRLQTNGGVMFDVGLTYANEETQHRQAGRAAQFRRLGGRGIAPICDAACEGQRCL